MVKKMTLCWIIVEKGLKGTENQCIALAEAAGLSPVIKNFQVRQPWKTINPYIPFFNKFAFAAGSADFTAPWPDVIIAAGRKTIAPSFWIKKQSKNKTKLVFIFSPVIKSKNFDLVIAPRHDQYKGSNVFEITGALSLITDEKLAVAKAEWQNTLGPLPLPRIAVLIGGNSRTHQMTQAVVDRLIRQLAQLQMDNYSLMITASRRTPDEYIAQMRHALNGSNIHFWDGTGANPYFGYLASADAILVTEDSVSMPLEAISTGKPVYIIPMAGGSARFKRFHDYLYQKHFARLFEGRIEDWTYQPPDDLHLAATKVKELLA
jgi:mitochondrial fission protein ELM1